MSVTITVTSTDQLGKIAEQLRGGGHDELGKTLLRAVREAGKAAAEDAKSALMKVQVTGVKTAKKRAGRVRALSKREHALRATLATAVGTRDIGRGVAIEVASNRLPKNLWNMPQHLESTKGWRHPVFGNRNVWSASKAGPWFYPTIRSKEPGIRDRVSTGIDEALQKIAQTAR